MGFSVSSPTATKSDGIIYSNFTQTAAISGVGIGNAVLTDTIPLSGHTEKIVYRITISAITSGGGSATLVLRSKNGATTTDNTFSFGSGVNRNSVATLVLTKGEGASRMTFDYKKTDDNNTIVGVGANTTLNETWASLTSFDLLIYVSADSVKRNAITVERISEI